MTLKTSYRKNLSKTYNSIDEKVGKHENGNKERGAANKRNVKQRIRFPFKFFRVLFKTGLNPGFETRPPSNCK